MAESKSKKKIFRCYAHKKKKGNWYGICLDLNIATEAGSFRELQKDLHDAIDGYLKIVCNSKDKDSIRDLLFRPAPLVEWLRYYSVIALYKFHKIKSDIPFKRSVSHPALNNC